MLRHLGGAVQEVAAEILQHGTRRQIEAMATLRLERERNHVRAVGIDNHLIGAKRKGFDLDFVVVNKEAETHSVSIRRLGSDGQKVMPTDEALAALVEEATPPDVKRMRDAA